MFQTQILLRPTSISIPHHHEQPSKGGLEQCPSFVMRSDLVSSSPHEEGLQWSHHQKRAWWRVIRLEREDPLFNFKIENEHSNSFAQIWWYTLMKMLHWAVQEYYDALIKCLSWSLVKFSVGSFLWDRGSTQQLSYQHPRVLWVRDNLVHVWLVSPTPKQIVEIV